MKRPDYWDHTPPPLWTRPLAALYRLGGALHRRLSTPKKVRVPVISVGNVVAGGAGKTPSAMLIANTLLKAGMHPHFLSRGYGANVATPTRVSADKHTARDVGDEPLLLSLTAPCWVYARRSESAVLAVNDGADCLVCDDAHQHHALHKDVRLLVIDGEGGFGNAHVHPAGPLREPLESALARADAVLFIGEDVHSILLQIPLSMPVFHGDIVARNPEIIQGMGPLVAFAGIARPAKFFKSLRDIGADVIAEHSFNDHHHFSDTELHRLRDEAESKHAILMTTEKDWVRLPPDMREICNTLPIELVLNQPDNFYDFLMRHVQHAA